jgi:hypothetical protein
LPYLSILSTTLAGRQSQSFTLEQVTDSELEKLLLDLESDRVERTQALRDTDKFGEAICAFANDLPDHRRPGVLLVGVADDGSCAGVEITEQTLQTLRRFGRMAIFFHNRRWRWKSAASTTATLRS